MSTNNLPPTKSRVLRSALVVAAATSLSRITGFLRDVVLAYFFGTGSQIQAFIIAFRLPNLLRDLIAEGPANAALVPIFSKMLYNNRKEEFLKVAQFLFKIILSGLVVIVIVAQIFSSSLVRLIAPGFLEDPQKLALAIELVRITFIYVLLIGLAAYNTAILNSLHNFAPSAIGPALLNISLIIAAFISVKFLAQPVMGLAWAVVAGGVLQIACQLPWLRSNQVLPWNNFFNFKIDPEVKTASKRVGKLFLPRVMGTAVYEINVFVDTIFASLSFLVGPGAIAAIYYANRIIAFPIGIVAFSFASALLPQFSRLVAEKDTRKLTDNFSFAMKFIMAVMVPVSLFIGVFSTPIIKVIFERGEFSSVSTDITSLALLFYSLGLFFFAAVKIMLVCFYAFEDTRKPVEIAFGCLILNIILIFILAKPLKVGGLALASSISAFVNLTLLCKYLKKHIPDLNYKNIFGPALFRIAVCSLIMLVITKLCWMYLLVKLPLILGFTLNLIMAGLLYLGLGFIFNISEIKGIWQWILKRS